jgi:hypothetical protein
MTPVSPATVRQFEAYVLMSMRRWLKQLGHVTAVDGRLAEHGFTLDDASRIHQQIADALRDQATQFETIQRLLGADGRQPDSLAFLSVFWPEFCFTARAGADGGLDEARYRHSRGQTLQADSPTKVPLWSCDVEDFATRFGPLTFGSRLPVTHEVLPCYESHDFDWEGERYGATFHWGLFLNASQNWD